MQRVMFTIIKKVAGERIVERFIEIKNGTLYTESNSPEPSLKFVQKHFCISCFAKTFCLQLNDYYYRNNLYTLS